MARNEIPQEQRQEFRPGTAEGLMAAAQDMQKGKYVGGTQAAAPKSRSGRIGTKEVQEARKVLRKYKEGKAALEQNVIENERWYQLRHWEFLRKDANMEVEPTSAWLFNSLANKHADAMDNFPAANILPREEGDKAEAEMLTSIIPVILEQCDFEAVYDEHADTKLKSGAGIYGTFWDASRHNGLGDIVIKEIDVVNLFWESGIKNIQDSRNVFNVELVDNDLLLEQYPQCAGKLGHDAGEVSSYIHDDTIDTSEKSCVIDWYYKKEGKLHYCKFVADVVLFATENEPEYAEKGWYWHGQYPFDFDPLFRLKGSPYGFGYIDVAKSCQEYIDRSNQAIMENLEANARPRHFVLNDGGVNEAEYANYHKPFVHVEGGLTNSILPIAPNPLPGIYLQIMDNKINELKEVTGNRDISTGGSTAGVTAASAIAAMQEAGSKLSRDNNKASYRVFRSVCMKVIELIRQFYDLPRCFRIMGQDGTARFVQYSNENLQPNVDGDSTRVPVFDIEVTAQKQSPYSKMSQNELALQFYSAGFFNPQMADQALACLDMMDFDRKNPIMTKIQQNGTMFQMMQMMMQQMVGMANTLDPSGGLVNQIMQQYGMAMPGIGAPTSAEGQEALGAENVGEAGNTKKARQRVADSTAPT